MTMVSYSHTNVWELAGDQAVELHPEQTVNLYAKSLLEDGSFVITNADVSTHEPYLAAMERVINKLPWTEVSVNEFNRLITALLPILQLDFTTESRIAIRSQLITKWRLLNPDTVDILPTESNIITNTINIKPINISTAAIKKIDINSVNIARITPDTAEFDWTNIPVNSIIVINSDVTDFDWTKIPVNSIIIINSEVTDFDFTKIPVNMVVIINVITDDFDFTKIPALAICIVSADNIDIPANVFAVVKIDKLDTDSWQNVYDLAFNIMGLDGLYVPQSNSYLGIKYKALKLKILNKGIDWRTDPVIIKEWTDYWKLVRKALDSRRKVKLIRKINRANQVKQSN